MTDLWQQIFVHCSYANDIRFVVNGVADAEVPIKGIDPQIWHVTCVTTGCV